MRNSSPQEFYALVKGSFRKFRLIQELMKGSAILWRPWGKFAISFVNIERKYSGKSDPNSCSYYPRKNRDISDVRDKADPSSLYAYWVPKYNKRSLLFHSKSRIKSYYRKRNERWNRKKKREQKSVVFIMKMKICFVSKMYRIFLFPKKKQIVFQLNEMKIAARKSEGSIMNNSLNCTECLIFWNNLQT